MRRTVILTILSVIVASTLNACENALSELVGYTLVAATDVDQAQLREATDGTMTAITLRNGMTFRFRKALRERWIGGLRESVFVFSKTLSEEQVQWFRKNGMAVPSDLEYVLLMNDSTYDVQRVR